MSSDRLDCSRSRSNSGVKLVGWVGLPTAAGQQSLCCRMKESCARVERDALERVVAGRLEGEADVGLALAEGDRPFGERRAERLARHRHLAGHRIGGEAEAAGRRAEGEGQQLRAELDVHLPGRARQAFADEEVGLVDDRLVGLRAVDGGFRDDTTHEARERPLRRRDGGHGHAEQRCRRQDASGANDEHKRLLHGTGDRGDGLQTARGDARRIHPPPV